MKKAVVVLCVVAVLLAIFGGVAAVKLAKTRDAMAGLYSDEWYSMYRMTELVELSGEEMLPLVNHQGHYGLVNWSVDTAEVRMLLQDYELLLQLTAEAEDSQLAEDGRALLEELNGKIQIACGKVVDACLEQNGESAGKLLPEDPVAVNAIAELKGLYQEYKPDMDALFKRDN